MRIVRGRDAAAFHLLYQRHAPVMYSTAVRLAGNTNDADDAMQNAWIRAADRLDRFLWKSALRTWLIAILVNCVREIQRGRSHVPLEDAEATGALLPTEELPGVVDPIDLDRALAGMPPRCREVLVLHDIEGFTHENIGTILDITPGTSKSQLSRGRRWLRRALGAEYGGKAHERT